VEYGQISINFFAQGYRDAASRLRKNTFCLSKKLNCIHDFGAVQSSAVPAGFFHGPDRIVAIRRSTDAVIGDGLRREPAHDFRIVLDGG